MLSVAAADRSGDLLFGADGVHSRVRQHILPDAPSPRYTGAAIVNTIVDRKSVGLPPGGLDFPAFVFAPTGFVGIFGLSGSRLAWGVTESVAKPPSLDRDGWAEYYSSGAAIEAIREHYGAITTEPVRSLVASMDGAKMQLWTPYELDELPRWSRGRTLLLGNAAHAMPPNGQGSAMALEDVAFLARLFDSDDVRAGGHEALFARFEAVRRRRVAYVRKMGKSASPIKSSTAPDSWKWWAKKWGSASVLVVAPLIARSLPVLRAQEPLHLRRHFARPHQIRRHGRAAVTDRACSLDRACHPSCSRCSSEGVQRTNA